MVGEVATVPQGKWGIKICGSKSCGIIGRMESRCAALARRWARASRPPLGVGYCAALGCAVSFGGSQPCGRLRAILVLGGGWVWGVLCRLSRFAGGGGGGRQLRWVPSHLNVHGNEQVDLLAKMG